MIDRRTFLSTLTGGLLAAPLAAAEAQQAGQLYRLLSRTANPCREVRRFKEPRGRERILI